MYGEKKKTKAYLVVELAVMSLAFVVDQLEGVAAITIHEAVAIRNTTVTKQEGHLVGGLRTQGDEVPEHVRILQMSAWIALLRVNEAWEEDWIADEEDWCVVSNQVPDAILGVVLDGKATWITDSVGTTRLATWCTNTHVIALKLAPRAQW